MKESLQNFRILTTKGQIIDMLKIVEQAGRTCYKSNDKITEDSYKQFIAKIIKNGHESVLEHCNISVEISTDRGITHELVRHRVASYCISGDTKILRFNSNKENLTIKKLYDRQNTKNLRGRNKLMTLRSMTDEKMLVPNKFKQIIYSGKKDVWEVKTSLGYKIKTTKEHIFFNESGEVALGDLTVGSKVFVNGVSVLDDRDWLYQKYHVEGLSLSEIARLSCLSTHTVRKYLKKYELQKTLGAKPKNFKPWNKGLKEGDDPRVAKQANTLRKHQHSNGFGENNSNWKKNPSQLTNSGKRLRFSKKPKVCCCLCGSTKNLENHHIDGNIDNMSNTNKQTLCITCHKLVHRGYNVKKAILDEIIYITFVGEEDTYDIEMFDPYHNFVANGFVVHNSQSSTRYCNYSKDKFGNEINCIKPSFWQEPEDLHKRLIWQDTMNYIELQYMRLIEAGATPQEARSVLPNSLQTDIVVTMNLRSWKNFFKLRTNKAAHPQMRELANNMLDKFRSFIPVVFD